jgi:hypothetical protein
MLVLMIAWLTLFAVAAATGNLEEQHRHGDGSPFAR